MHFFILIFTCDELKHFKGKLNLSNTVSTVKIPHFLFLIQHKHEINDDYIVSVLLFEKLIFCKLLYNFKQSWGILMHILQSEISAIASSWKAFTQFHNVW